MCGICGVYNYGTKEPADERLIEAMAERIIHRGPDDEGQYLDGSVGFGVRRLSIIDVEGGHQPIHNEDMTVWIVFNGEIYNFKELRSELEKKGHRFYTQSDTEAIVHSYEEWGDDCVLHLNGIFGFALWNQPQRHLLLARDHFGVKPLYYYDDSKRLLFGSEIKALLADRSVSRKVDTDALNLFLTFRFVPSPLTMFKGIFKLPPGHRLIVHGDGSRLERFYWPSPSKDISLSELDYIELLQERLEAAVRRQMVSDVPIGALLSGGIDSGTVVAIMSGLSSDAIRTFSVGFKDGGNANELDDARKTAIAFRTDHHEIVLDSLDYQQLLKQVIWHLEEPVGTTSALAMYFVCQLAHQHVKIVLTGQGVDEPMAGYHRYLGERYGQLYRRVPAPLREQLIRPAIEMLPRQERIKRAVRSLGIEETSQRFLQIYSVFSSAMKAKLLQPDQRAVGTNGLELRIINYWRQGVEHLEPLLQMTYVDARLSLADDLLLYGDKMSMAHSVEARVPFLDLEYMAIAETLPASLRIRRLTRKDIHKKAISKWLPPNMIHRKKRGFETPIDRWFRSELSGYVRQILLSPDSACEIYFNSNTIDSLIHDHVNGRQDNRRQLFSLLVFELWHRQFVNAKNTEPQ